MPLFGTRDEAENRFKEARRYSDPSKKEFDLDKATILLEEAVMLKPYEDKFRKHLEEVKAIKLNLSKKFSMHIDDVFVVKGRGLVKGRGTVVTGVVQQGLIRSGDKVRIVGRMGDRNDMLKRIEKFEGTAKTHGFVTKAIPGDNVGLELTELRSEDVEPGDRIEKLEA